MTVMDPVEQRRDALRKANEAKKLHGQLRVSLRNGTVMEARSIAAHVLSDDYERFGGMPVRVLLGSIWCWGPEKVTRACKAADVSEMCLVGELTPGGRDRLSTLLTRSQSGF